MAASCGDDEDDGECDCVELLLSANVPAPFTPATPLLAAAKCATAAAAANGELMIY